MAANYLPTPGSVTTLYIKYYPESKNLEIGFRTRSVYKYFKVPLRVWRNYYKAALAGLSGEFFNEFIRDKYQFERIT
ncbi:MAG TPA: KTSC domain-containing protein [Chitinophagaceae bacterium]|jgi:lysyl-tRNA synthetase class 2|nr:KTSC domain-containing protein [Chitinophagaceae bacterium]